jgi:hypothetical protein
MRYPREGVSYLEIRYLQPSRTRGPPAKGVLDRTLLTAYNWNQG